MASNSLKIALIAILATFVVVGCGEKEPEYKVEGPKATDMQEVAGVASSNGQKAPANSVGVPGNTPDAGASSSKGAPKAPIQDHK